MKKEIKKIKKTNIMKIGDDIKVITYPKIAITLKGDSYNSGEDYNIHWRELLEGKIGDEFYSNNNNCGRDSHLEFLKIIYKDDSGCLCRLETQTSGFNYDTLNSDGTEESSTEFIYFEF